MYKRDRSQLLYFSVVIIFFLTFVAVYGLGGNKWLVSKSLNFNRNEAGIVKPAIKANTVITKEIRYVCGDKVSTSVPTTSDLVGTDFAGMSKKYPPEQGWSIDDTKDNKLTIVRTDQKLCPVHQEFRHLGVSEGYLAIYEGPLGYNQKVLQREEIVFTTLPPEMQSDLTLAMNYSGQPSDTQAKLKASYEFASEVELNSALENFDEFREQP